MKRIAVTIAALALVNLCKGQNLTAIAQQEAMANNGASERLVSSLCESAQRTVIEVRWEDGLGSIITHTFVNGDRVSRETTLEREMSLNDVIDRLYNRYFLKKGYEIVGSKIFGPEDGIYVYSIYVSVDSKAVDVYKDMRRWK